jgi:hypothetical protein
MDVVAGWTETFTPPRKKPAAPLQSAAALEGDACTRTQANYVYDNMHLMKTVGQVDSRKYVACQGKRPASMVRLPDVDGKRVLRLTGGRPDGTPFEVKCANREECLVGWAKGVGRFWDKQSLSARKGQRAPWIFTDKQRFVVVTKDIPARCKNVVSMLKTKGSGPYIFVKPLVLVRGMMQWEDVNRVYVITKEAPRGREYDRFVQAGGKPENWFSYSGNLQLVQLMYMQGLMARAGRVFMRVFERLSPSPQVARIASAIRKTFADPGAVYASGGTGQDAPTLGWQGVGNVHGVAMKLRGARKDMDDADFAGLYLGGAALAKPLMVTVIHEFAHHIDFAANDEFIGGHNYGFWSLLRFFELTMVAAGMIAYDWRTNAKNFDAASYGGFDPYYQRDWYRIQAEVRVKGGTKEDLARKGGAVGADKGSYEKTVWDDMWADVSNNDRNADNIVMQRFKKLVKGVSTA